VPSLSPCSYAELVRKLRRLGYEKGPIGRGKHQIMTGARGTVRIPNPHRGDIGLDLLGWILKSATISRDEWNNA
jgi:hypothetical protein